MDILLIAHAFPPDTAVGSIRARNVAMAFRDAGHRVQVITARQPGATTDPAEDSGIIVHRVRSFSNPSRALSSALARLRTRRQEAPPSTPMAARHIPGWRRHLLSLLWVPDDRQGFIGPAVARSRRLIRSGIDLVYTTAPPFSDHLAGFALKKLTGVRWVVEFRDPWADNPFRPAERSSREADAMNRWLERRCLRAADNIVTVAHGTMALLQAKVPEGQREKFILARNGIQGLAPARGIRQPGRPFRILHAGSLYQDRDPRPFFRALAAVCGRQHLDVNDLRIDFIGNCDAYRGQSLPELTRELGIDKLVRFTDWIPRDQCRTEMDAADLLVLFAQNYPNQVANKLYDYLATRQPILAFTETESESARMLTRIGGHYIVSHFDQDTIEVTLEAALRGPAPKPADDCEIQLEEWSTRRQLDHLLSCLGLNDGGLKARARDR